jgi:hypothetical protein
MPERPRFGYKAHVAVDQASGLVRGAIPTPANMSGKTPLLVHRGVQKIHPFGALASPEPRKRGVRRQRRMNLLSAPVH